MKNLTFIISACLAVNFAQAATVSFSTNNYRVLLNHKLDVPVFIQSTDKIYSLSADLVYESQYLSAMDSDGNITNGTQPVLNFTSIFPNPKKYCSALEDSVQGRIVWGISQNLPASSGTSFTTNSHLLTASFNADEIGTNSLLFGFKRTQDTTGGVINTTWDSANVYVITDKLPQPELNVLNPYSPGSSLSLNWPAVTDAEFYRAYCAFDPDFTNIFKQSAIISDTNYTFSSLIETTKFYYLVMATNVIGQRGFSVTNNTIQDFNPPTNVFITVNTNAYYTDSNIVSVKFSGDDLTPMAVKADIDDGSVSSWSTYSYWITYHYTSTWVNGEKEITGIMKDSAGQTSAVATTIFLDSIAPSNASIVINNGAGTTTLVGVTLTLSADDIAPLDVIVANKSDFSDGIWQTNLDSRTWTLPNNGAGIYTVYARYRDPLGKLSPIASDDIYYSTATDTNIFLVSPADNITVKAGTINFSWLAEADVNAPQFISISTIGVFSATTNFSRALTSGNYSWYVYGTNANNVITKSETRTFALDSIAPSNASVVINNGAGTTTTYAVSLTLNAVDANPMEMIIGNHSSFSNNIWETYNSSKAWNLPDNGEGTYTVYAKFRDSLSNMSAVVSDDIYYPGSDTNIFLVFPTNSSSVVAGIIDFSWTNGANVHAPQFISISTVGIFPATTNYSRALIPGTYTWFVYATNTHNTISKSETNSLTVMPGSDTNIFLVLPTNEASFVAGTIDFSWTNGADLYAPQFISITPGDVYAATGSYSRSLSSGNYTWFVYGTNVNNTISKSETRMFVLDSIGPSNASVVINNGAGTTAVLGVSLTLNAVDANPMEMIVANDSSFSNHIWETFNFSKAWNLPDNGKGTYTVYARFRDSLSNMSAIVSDDIYYPGSDTNIVLVFPTNNAFFVEGTVDFSWTNGADVYAPQYISIIPGGVYPATTNFSLALTSGNYTWFVYSTNTHNTVSVSETRSLSIYSIPYIDPIPDQTVREHQILFVTLKINDATSITYDDSEIVGVHYLDTNRFLFSLIPDFGTAGQVWDVPFFANNLLGTATQNMSVAVYDPAKKVKKELQFEDVDEDIIDIKYNGIKKNNSIVTFDGQRLIISNAYSKGKLVFKVKRNKKAGGDGLFDLQEVHVDNDGKGINLAASVANIFAEQFSIDSIKIGGAILSNLYINYAKVISVKKGTIIGEIIVSNGFKNLTATEILDAKIVVHDGDNISVKTKNDIHNSTIIVNGSGNALAVKKIGTGGKGSITDSKIIVGLPEGADYTTLPAQAGFKLIKTKTMTNVEIAGSDYAKGKKGKMVEPKIKVKTPANSSFYHTESGVVTKEPIQ